MTWSEHVPPLIVPERRVPVPTSVSPEAQGYLGLAAGFIQALTESGSPSLDDTAGWRESAAAADAAVLQSLGDFDESASVTIEIVELASSKVFIATPKGFDESDRRVYLHIHGGGFYMAGGDICRLITARNAANLGLRTWGIDYRLAPDHPYPAALDDCMDAYRKLLDSHEASQIVIGGGSAGGNLTAALALRSRDEGLPRPAAAIILTPAVDFTGAGDTLHTLAGVDMVIPPSGTDSLFQLYANGHDLTDPYISPLFGDFTRGFPPSLLATGTRDMLLSDTVRLHRALREANITAELHVLEAAPHGFFGYPNLSAPEDRALDREIRQFIDRHTS